MLPTALCHRRRWISSHRTSDVWRVDIKGFSDRAYQRLAKVTRWRGILDVAKRAQEKWHLHVEVVTNIIPTINDDDEQLNGIARWIYDNLGELTPWHVTRFHPEHYLLDNTGNPCRNSRASL